MPSDPVLLELFSSRFAAIAQEMGAMLQRTSLSTNVKEREDFSCALLDAHGELVVNAPHIPVHLGALGLCVRELGRRIDLEDGDTVVTNHPAFGGSHLPDVTTVTPVYDTVGSGLLVGYVANRAHHAEIGGTRPGSVPPAARRLVEEGVVIHPVHVLRRNTEHWPELRKILLDAPYPTRAPDENLADIAAAVAANHLGVKALQALAAEHGAHVVLGQMSALKEHAAALMERAISRLPDGKLEAHETLDDLTPIHVCISIRGKRAKVDFTGSADVHPGNLNATPAIVRSAVLYVLRLLVDEPLPLNEGLLDPVELVIPHGMLNPEFPDDPREAPAVVGGNVETSQRLVDTLLKALDLVACSQGTMNNLIFGDGSFGYYETVAGGCGAGPGFDGADAVHSHMTNTLITDPEVLERRFPVRLERFGVRSDSGGPGRFRGGNGVVRELRFLRPLSLSILSQHRAFGPYGAHGGAAGAAGRQWVVRANGERQELGAVDGCEVATGDRLILQTPGGGGWGSATDEGSEP